MKCSNIKKYIQLKTELSPTVMVVGSAENELIMGSVRDDTLHPAINIKIIIVKNRVKNLK